MDTLFVTFQDSVLGQRIQRCDHATKNSDSQWQQKIQCHESVPLGQILTQILLSFVNCTYRDKVRESRLRQFRIGKKKIVLDPSVCCPSLDKS